MGFFGSFGRTHFFLLPSMRFQSIIQSTRSNNRKTNHALGSTREHQLKNLPHTACPKPSGLTEGLFLGPWDLLHRVHTCCTESKNCSESCDRFLTFPTEPTYATESLASDRHPEIGLNLRLWTESRDSEPSPEILHRIIKSFTESRSFHRILQLCTES